MNLFRIFFLPFAYMYYSYRFWDAEERKHRLNTFVRGCLGFIPALILFLIISRFFPMPYGSVLLALGVGLRDTMVWPILACAAYPLFYRYGESTRDEDKRNLLAFIAGFLSMVGIYEWIAGPAHPGLYSLFLLPVIRAAIVFTVSAFAARVADELGMKMVAYVALGVGCLLVAAIPGALWLSFHYVLGIACFVGVCWGGWYLHDRLD